MVEIKVQELSREAFDKYGSYVNLINPVNAVCGGTGHPVAFYRDMLQVPNPSASLPSFSTCRVEKREMIVAGAEYHGFAYEANIPLDADMLLWVVVSGNGPCPTEKMECFRIPKGTLVTCHPGVWHGAPFVFDTDVMNTLVVLPEHTYSNDSAREQFDDARKVKVSF